MPTESAKPWLVALLVLLIALAPFPLSPAYANPLPMGKADASYLVLSFFLALLSEVAVTMLLLKKYRLRFVRLGLVYLAVNLVSFALFIVLILPAFSKIWWVGPVGAELFVVLLETALLLMLVNLGWFRHEESGEVTLRAALIAVTAGNVTSVIFGFLLLIPVFAFLKSVLL
jgi:hypothetical protein